MNDPHVVKLKYRLTTIDLVKFEDPEPINMEAEAFRIVLRDGLLVVEFKDHFSSVKSARATAESFLRAWEIDNALRMNRLEIRFVYEDAEVIDRNPSPDRALQTIQINGIDSQMSIGGDLVVSVARHSYPAPPEAFQVNTNVESLWQRYERYLNGQEPLLSMAYFVLTWLEDYAGGRDAAAHRFAIPARVLSTLGKLTANRGDATTARKRHAESATPLTGREKLWIEAVVKSIIRRFGQVDLGNTLDELEMDDLPNGPR